MLTQVFIGGVDVASCLHSYEYESTFGDLLPEITLKFNRNVNNLVLLDVGLSLVIYRGYLLASEELAFQGYVEKYEPDGGAVIVTGIDKLWDLVRNEITVVYESSGVTGGKISEIFLDIITNQVGLNADHSTVQDSGTTYILNKFVCNHTDPFERCKKLADILNWQFYYRADTDKVYFEPKGFNTNSSTLVVGDNVIQVPKWHYDVTDMCNDVTVVGAYQEVETTKVGVIDSTPGFSSTGIIIDYTPISVKVFDNTVSSSTPLLGGVPDSSATFDYSVDKTNKNILPKDGSVFVVGDTYEVRYSFAAPIPVNMYDQYSIDKYGGGDKVPFKKTITFNDIRDVSDAETRGVNYLAKYSVPFVYSTLKVKVSSLLSINVGENISVVDSVSVPNVDQVVLINKLRIRYPADYDEIDVGDRYWRLADWQSGVMEKLKRAEEDELANLDILNQIVNVNNASYSPIVLGTRELKVSTQLVSGTNVFILGNDSYGVLGTNKLGTAGIAAEVLQQVIPGDGAFKEYFYDTDYVDLDNSTATVDTVNFRLVD